MLKSKGIAGHSGYPSSGESAIHKLIPILNDILNYPWPKDRIVGVLYRPFKKKFLGDTTVNIGLIQGGQALNAWAAEAQASIFFRVTTSVAALKEQLLEVVNGQYVKKVINDIFQDAVRWKFSLTMNR